MSDSRGAVDEIATTLEGMLPPERPIPLHAPVIGDLERETMADCLDSGFVSSVGEYVGRFERAVAEKMGVAHAIAVSNGTSALQVALALAGVGPGDLVIVPALSFVATANAVAHVGAGPYFVDSDPLDLGMSPASLTAALEAATRTPEGVFENVSGRRISAVVPMHTLGHAAQIESIVAIADEYGIPVVEDAAESLGTHVAERHTGNFGRLGIVSFNGNKIVTTGGGGIIVTDDPALAARARHLTTTAKRPHAWEFFHDEVAWNYRMPNINAALGVAQMAQLPEFLSRKRALAHRYRDAFADVDGVEVVWEPEGTTSNFWLNAIRLVDGGRDDRDRLLRITNDAQIQTRPMWNLLSGLPMFADAPRTELMVAHRLEDTTVCLPSSASLG